MCQIYCKYEFVFCKCIFSLLNIKSYLLLSTLVDSLNALTYASAETLETYRLCPAFNCSNTMLMHGSKYLSKVPLAYGIRYTFLLVNLKKKPQLKWSSQAAQSKSILFVKLDSKFIACKNVLLHVYVIWMFLVTLSVSHVSF